MAKKVEKKNDEVPLKTICSQMKIEPRDARRRLRKAKIAGHDTRERWVFKKGSSALEKAKEALRPSA